MSTIHERNILLTFKATVDHFDFGKYAPFYHGTSRSRLADIKRFGLLTRKDAPSSCDVSINKWGADYIRSLPDRVYFAACTERADIVKGSCQKALELEGDKAFTTDELSAKCAIIELINFRPYIRYFTTDEDSYTAKETLSKLFSMETLRDYQVMDGLYIMKKMDRQVARLYEEAFIVGDNPLVRQLLDMTPPALFSIADWGTFAITTSIAPRDMMEVPYIAYKTRENCRERLGYPDINEAAYYQFIQYHDAAHVDAFKAAIRKE